MIATQLRIREFMMKGAGSHVSGSGTASAVDWLGSDGVS
jgi:hypothetical protein